MRPLTTSRSQKNNPPAPLPDSPPSTPPATDDENDDDDDEDDDEEEEEGGAAAKQLESLRAGVEQMRVKLRAATALAVLATAKIGVGLSPGAMPVA